MNEQTHFGFQKIPLAEKQKKIDAFFNSVVIQNNLMNDLLSGGTLVVWK